MDYEFVDDLPPNQEVTFRKASGPPPVQASLVSPEPTIQPDQSPPPKQNSDFVVAPKPQKSGSAQQPNRKGTQKPSTLWQRGIVLKDWLLEVVTTAAKPKPKKPVIVIPPRSPQSETYPGAGDADPSLESAGTDRAKTHNSVAQAQIGENSQASSPSPSHPGDPQAEQSSAASTDAINGGEPAVSRSADVGADRGETDLKHKMKSTTGASLKLMGLRPDLKHGMKSTTGASLKLRQLMLKQRFQQISRPLTH